jgi:hypothetical protein
MAPSRSSSIMLLNNPCLTNDVLDSPSSSQRASFHGYSVTTTITSSARRPATTPRAKRHHDDRKRFPTTEALFQIVFRGLTLLLHIAAIVLVWALDKANVVSGFVGTRVLYRLVRLALSSTSISATNRLSRSAMPSSSTDGNSSRSPTFRFPCPNFPLQVYRTRNPCATCATCASPASSRSTSSLPRPRR